jgi:hypothetical protein
MACSRLNFTVGFEVEGLSTYRPLNIMAVRFLETWAAHFAVTGRRSSEERNPQLLCSGKLKTRSGEKLLG